jgi:hypothetical protein
MTATIATVPQWAVVLALAFYIIGAAWVAALHIELILIRRRFAAQINLHTQARRSRRAAMQRENS